jgi:hypothetical protein
MCDVRCRQEARSRNYFETHQIIYDDNQHLNNTASASHRKSCQNQTTTEATSSRREKSPTRQ